MAGNDHISVELDQRLQAREMLAQWRSEERYGTRNHVSGDQYFFFRKVEDGCASRVPYHAHEAEVAAAMTEREMVVVRQCRVGASHVQSFRDILALQLQ